MYSPTVRGSAVTDAPRRPRPCSTHGRRGRRSGPSTDGVVLMTSVLTPPTVHEGTGQVAASIDRRDAAHLLNRVGFGGSTAEIDQLAASGDWATAVERMLDTSG